MICARPGCGGPVRKSKRTKPVKYCDDKECRRIIRRFDVAVWKARKLGLPLPFLCQSCGQIVRPVVEQESRYCGRSACREAEELAGEIVEIQEPEEVGGDMIGIDRGTRTGFVAYMQNNPEYFQATFPGQTIKQAWGEVNGIRT